MKKILLGILAILACAMLAGCNMNSEPELDWDKTANYDPAGDFVLGSATAALDGTGGRYKETVLGNFIMDGIAEYARYITGEKVDFALHNGQNLSASSLATGDITNTEILNLIGSDAFVVVGYKGSQIKTLINTFVNSTFHSSTIPSGTPGTPGVNNGSGWKSNCVIMVSREVSYTIEPGDVLGYPPTATDIRVKGVEIKDDTVYRVAVGNGLGGINAADASPGSSGLSKQVYENIGPADNPVSYNPTQLRHALAMYVLAKGTISPGDYPLGRITGKVPSIVSP
jgi:2',3'-cyclic-nucleotide 2'-phosphodiesterase (5'-nucleotidase family)